MPQAIKTHKPTTRFAQTYHSARPNGKSQWYGNPIWRAVRKRYLSRNPLCSDPFGWHAEDRVVVPATDVHHVGGKDGQAYDPECLEALCHSCHSTITRREANSKCR